MAISNMFHCKILILLCISAALPECSSSKFSKQGKLKLLKEIVGGYFQDIIDEYCWQKPKLRNIAFAVKLSTSIFVNVAVIKFDSILTSEGKGYDKNTGTFTAPTAGMYQFAWHILTQRKRKAHVFLYVNGIEQWRSYADDGPQGYDTGSGTVILRLKHGDKVQLRTYGNGNDIYGYGYTTFAGNLLYR